MFIATADRNKFKSPSGAEEYVLSPINGLHANLTRAVSINISPLRGLLFANSEN